MRDDQDNLFEISQKLISFLGGVLENASYETQAIWQIVIRDLRDILSYYENNKDVVGFAEVQVSLSKYFGYYSTAWMSHEQPQELNQFVSKIVFLSLKMLTVPRRAGVYSRCGHEDGACFFGPLGNRFIPSGDLIVKDWPILSAGDAVNFEFMPDIKTLGKGEHLYRVVGPNNSHDGPWWILGALPYNKTEWRSDLAVPISYNSNDYYVDFILNKPLKVWIGIAASVRVPKQKCILKGGGKQIWIDSEDLTDIKLQKSPTNW